MKPNRKEPEASDEVTAPETEVEQTDQSRPAKGRLLLVIFASIGWGALGGLCTVVWRQAATPGRVIPATAQSADDSHLPEDLVEPSAASAVDERVSLDSNEVRESHLDQLRRADFLLHYGSVRDAQAIYRALQAESAFGDNDWLTYRMAVVAEHLGDVASATRWYSKLCGESAPDAMWVLGMLGRSRVLMLADDLAGALRLLRALEQTQALSTHPLEGEHAHLLAQACLLQSIHNSPHSLDDFIAVPPRQSLLHEQLDALRLIAEVELQPEQAIEPQLVVESQLGDDPAFMQLTFISPTMACMEAIQQLSTTTGYSIRLSEAAVERLQARSFEPYFEHVNFASLLDSLLSRLDLVWHREPEHLVVQTVAEVDDDRLVAYTFETAHRAATRAFIAFPDHRESAATRFLVGTLEYGYGNYDQAYNELGTIVDQLGSLPLAQPAWFNYAKTLGQLGQPEAATEAFFRVVDMARDSPFESAAYAHIGRLSLEAGELETAIRPLIRAVTLSEQLEQKTIAIMHLATTYLYVDNPQAAITTLLERSQEVKQTKLADPFAVLEGLVKSKMRLEGVQSARAQEALFTAVGRTRASDFPSAMGHIIMADAFAALGLSTEMERRIERSLATDLPEFVRLELHERLSVHLERTNQLARAKSALQQSTEGASSVVAALKIARLQLQREEYDECVDSCRQILGRAPLTEENKKAALALMGRAFQAQSAFEDAALCFAGLLPSEKTK